MSKPKHQDFDKNEAAKKMYSKPRPAKDIQQEYTNIAYELGDTHFLAELHRGKMQQLTMRLSALKDEYAKAQETEAEEAKKNQEDGVIVVPNVNPIETTPVAVRP